MENINKELNRQIEEIKIKIENKQNEIEELKNNLYNLNFQLSIL